MSISTTHPLTQCRHDDYTATHNRWDNNLQGLTCTVMVEEGNVVAAVRLV